MPRRARITATRASRALPVAAIGALVLVSSACRAPTTATDAIPGVGRGVVGTVSSVVDGDTLELELGGQRELVRLLGIDTPETVHPSKPVECWGPEASALTDELLPPGTEVLVQRDQEARDRFGRLLAYVWRRHDHLFVNEALVDRGAARTLSIAPNAAHRADLAAAAHRARSSGRGLWGACPTEGEQG